MSGKMIRATIHLCAEDLPKGADCWDHGSFSISAQPHQRIKATKGTIFYSVGNLPAALLKELNQAGVKVAPPTVRRDEPSSSRNLNTSPRRRATSQENRISS